MKNTGLGVCDILPGDKIEFIASTTIVDTNTYRTFRAVQEFANDQDVDEIAMLVFETSPRNVHGRPVVWKGSSLTQRTIGAMEVMSGLYRWSLWYYDEAEVKEGLAGSRIATKEQVASYVRLTLGWKKENSPASTHEMDAVAACLYHQRMRGWRIFE